MYYKYEMHCHDNVCSACAHSTPEEMVAACVRAGYAGMAFTNHFLGSSTTVKADLPWAEKIDCYYAAYQRARVAAPVGFTVFFGFEHRYGCNVEELLTYGLSPEFLKAHPDMHLLPVAEYVKIVHEGGGIVVQAHPFRYVEKCGQTPLPAALLDGMETFNLFTDEKENQMAVAYAKGHGIIACAGGDIHTHTEQTGAGGMAFPYPIVDDAALVAAFLKGDGKCIVQGRVTPA